MAALVAYVYISVHEKYTEVPSQRNDGRETKRDIGSVFGCHCSTLRPFPRSSKNLIPK